MDFKAVSNDDPLWAFGQVRDRQSPVQKYLKPLPKGLDEEKVNLQTTCKFEDTIDQSGSNFFFRQQVKLLFRKRF